ncbi:hypothetical protein B0919_04840 [Hymenobacter sp. CRA2]|nr:hypothetical protein B0919_04840 [Hymenobacter sp. CRA2]
MLLASGDTLRGQLTLYNDSNTLVVKTADGATSTHSPLTVKAFAAKGRLLQKVQQKLAFRDQNINAMGETLYHNQAYTTVALDTAMHAFVSYRGIMRQSAAQSPGAGEPGFYEVLSVGDVCLWQRTSLHSSPSKSTPERSKYETDPILTADMRRDLRNQMVYKDIPSPVKTTQTRQIRTEQQLYLVTSTALVVPVQQAEKETLTLFKPNAAAIKQYARQHKLSFNKPEELSRIVDYANSLAPAATQP